MEPVPSTKTEETAPIRLISCVGVDLELHLLPHFLDHYARLGISPHHVHLILNSSDPASPNLDAADAILSGRGIPAGRRWIADYTSESMWAERRAIQRESAAPGDWIVNADMDELHEYPATLPEVVAFCESLGATCVQGAFVDRLSPNGHLSAVTETPALADQFPVRSDVAVTLFGTGEHHGLAGTIKMMLHRGNLFPKRGGHTPLKDEGKLHYLAGARLSAFAGAGDPEWRYAYPFRVHHYKWTATLQKSLERRLKTQGVSVAGKEYGGKIDRYLSTHGRVRIEDVSVLTKDDAADDWQDRVRRLRRAAPLTLMRNAFWEKAHGVKKQLLSLAR